MARLVELDQAFETLFKNRARKMVYWRTLYTCLYMWQVCLSISPGRGIEMLMTIRSRLLSGLKSASKIESDLVKGQAKGSRRTRWVSKSFERLHGLGSTGKDLSQILLLGDIEVRLMTMTARRKFESLQHQFQSLCFSIYMYPY